jgi:transposase-like protein
MSRIPPSQQIQQQIQQLLARGVEGDGSVVTELLTLGAQRVVQELLEQEVTTFLGREHYRRGARRIRGYRNGYRIKRVPTAEGTIPVQVPQVRDTADPFQSRLLTFLTGLDVSKITSKSRQLWRFSEVGLGL